MRTRGTGTYVRSSFSCSRQLYRSFSKKKGYRVAIAEQMEDPKLAKGLVKREVIRVVTPGTICDNKALDETKNNYIMSIAYVGGIYGVSTCDVSTGEFYLTELKDKRTVRG